MDHYELEAEDGAPGQRRQPGGDNYHHINTSGALKHDVSPHPDGAVVEDDYNHIDSAHNNPQSRGTFEDNYNHSDNPPNPVGSSGRKVLTGRQPKAIVVNSVVNKSCKTLTQPNTNDVSKNGKTLTQPNTNDVSKNGKTPTQPNTNDVSKNGKTPTQPNTNDVSKNGKIPTQPNTNDVSKNGKTATQPNTNDVYSVVNKKPKVASKPSLWGKPGVGNGGSVANSSGRPTRAEDWGVSPDDYNTLSFSETRNESAMAVGSRHKAYDHVTTDPADPYSKTRTGKPNVVIGSDYDHVKN